MYHPQHNIIITTTIIIMIKHHPHHQYTIYSINVTQRKSNIIPKRLSLSYYTKRHILTQYINKHCTSSI